MRSSVVTPRGESHTIITEIHQASHARQSSSFPTQKIKNPVSPSSAAAAASITSTDEAYMRRALDLARTALGKTYPNPAVGCVIVKDGAIIGEGYHPRAGLPHAEVYALRAAGQAAVGATAYVTLEPCDHYGRTPPCSKALVAAGVVRVVVGVGDPNPLVDGGGVATLTSAGVEVDVGCEENACYEINEEFMERIKAGT